MFQPGIFAKSELMYEKLAYSECAATVYLDRCEITKHFFIKYYNFCKQNQINSLNT